MPLFMLWHFDHAQISQQMEFPGQIHCVCRIRVISTKRKVEG